MKTQGEGDPAPGQPRRPEQGAEPAGAAMTPLDRRLHAFRPDLADRHLQGRVAASRYTDGEPACVTRAVLDLRRSAAATAPLDSQLLFGEPVTRWHEGDGWAWVQSRVDGYVGYVEAAGIGTARKVEASHRVDVLRSFRYPEPNLKAPPLDALSLMSPVAVRGERDGFCEIAGGGWLYRGHLRPLAERVPDVVASALLFLGVPYLWGGRSGLGLDCSALVQLALARAGLTCPRDSDLQAEAIGEAIPWEPGRSRPRRGDLLFMPGHVVLALDETRIVHANAHSMLVSVEPLSNLVARLAAHGEPGVTVIRRLPAA